MSWQWLASRKYNYVRLARSVTAFTVIILPALILSTFNAGKKIWKENIDLIYYVFFCLMPEDKLHQGKQTSCQKRNWTTEWFPVKGEIKLNSIYSLFITISKLNRVNKTAIHKRWTYPSLCSLSMTSRRVHTSPPWEGMLSPLH